MMTKPVTTTLAALALAGLLAACGGSGGGSDDVASVSGDDGEEQAQGDEASEEEELLDWVECMRGEGIDIPDPTRNADGSLSIEGNGIVIGGTDDGAGTSEDQEEGGDEEQPPFSPEDMEAAEEECGTPPNMGASDLTEEVPQEVQDSALEFAQCMRDEGIDFPDPDFSDQGPGGQAQTNENEASPEPGDGPMIAGPFGEVDLSDPETEAAYQACQDLLVGPDGEPGGPPAGEEPDEGADA